jgi:hypothetical protein
MRLRPIQVGAALIACVTLAFWLGGRMSSSEPSVTNQGASVPVVAVSKPAAPKPAVVVVDDDEPTPSDEDQKVINLDNLPKLGREETSNAASPVTRVPTGRSGGTTRASEPRNAPTAEPSSDGIDIAQAKTRLSGAAEMAKLCRRVGATTGPGKVQVTFSPSGAVSHAEVLPPYAGTPAGACVAQKFKMVTVSPFSGPATTLARSFYLAE